MLRTRSCLDLYPLIRPPKRPLALGRGRIRIPGFVRSPPTLAVYDVAHSLPRGGVGRGFTFTEVETRSISQTSLILLESIYNNNYKKICFHILRWQIFHCIHINLTLYEVQLSIIINFKLLEKSGYELKVKLQSRTYCCYIAIISLYRWFQVHCFATRRQGELILDLTEM